jgi:hypothetical protein
MFGSFVTMAALATVLSSGVAVHERANTPQVLQLSNVCSILCSNYVMPFSRMWWITLSQPSAIRSVPVLSTLELT